MILMKMRGSFIIYQWNFEKYKKWNSECIELYHLSRKVILNQQVKSHKIAEEVNITRQTVYRIKNELLGNAKPTND